MVVHVVPWLLYMVVHVVTWQVVGIIVSCMVVHVVPWHGGLL